MYCAADFGIPSAASIDALDKMTTVPKRRRFQFSLRTMFVVVTVFGCWLGWNIRKVRIRAIARQQIEAEGGQFVIDVFFIGGNLQLKRPGDPSLKLSFIRRLLGDEQVFAIMFPTAEAYYSVQMASPFPEADIY